MYRIPLFDIDWTLLKKNPEKNPHHEAFEYALQKVYSLPPSAKEGFLTEGKIDPQILLEVAVLSGVSESEAKKKVGDAMNAMVSYFRDHADEGNYETMPGVKDLLETLKSHDIRMGILTGNVEEIGWEKLRMVGIADYFTFGAFGSMALKRVDLIPIARKRAEKILKSKIPLETFVIVGDSPLDIACARDGGIHVIAVGAGHYKLYELTDADLVVDSLEEKEKILKFLKLGN